MKKNIDSVIFTNRIDLVKWLLKNLWEIDIVKLEKSEKERKYNIQFMRVGK